jgi:hypothetical protein
VAVLPVEPLLAPSHHILRGAVEPLAQRFGFAADIGPVSREDLVGAPSQQEVEGRSEQLIDSLADDRVKKLRQPTAQLETAGLVLFWTARGLQNAVERNENGSNDLTHDVLLWVGGGLSPRAPRRRNSACWIDMAGSPF